MTSLTAVRALTPILVMSLLLSSCGLLSSDVAVAGWPEVDLGAQVEVYKRFALDPGHIALAGSSAGGALAVEATAVQLPADALVLFNPAVGAASAQFVVDEPTIVFHSREDTIVPFSSAEAFCIGVTDCELVAFEEGDHGFFNDDPAFTATTTQMIEFLSTHGW